MSKLIDLVGKTFGRLTVVSRAENSAGNSARWVCACSCGGQSTVCGRMLRNGNTKSCGCLQRERTSRANKTHGSSRTKLYKNWKNMVARCENRNDKRFHRYGGRGIAVCPKWRHSFQAFYDDIGGKPTPSHSLERQDNNKGYSPCNVYWATPVTQANNRVSNALITYNSRTLTIAQWVRETGISQGALWARINRGWSPERALTTPVRKW